MAKQNKQKKQNKMSIPVSSGPSLASCVRRST